LSFTLSSFPAFLASFDGAAAGAGAAVAVVVVAAAAGAAAGEAAGASGALVGDELLPNQFQMPPFVLGAWGFSELPLFSNCARSAAEQGHTFVFCF